MTTPSSPEPAMSGRRLAVALGLAALGVIAPGVGATTGHPHLILAGGAALWGVVAVVFTATDSVRGVAKRVP